MSDAASAHPKLGWWRGTPLYVRILAGLILGVKYFGAEGAAWALVVSAAITFIATFWMLRRDVGVELGAAMTAGFPGVPSNAAGTVSN